jgi:hypothetical protein
MLSLVAALAVAARSAKVAVIAQHDPTAWAKDSACHNTTRWVSVQLFFVCLSRRVGTCTCCSSMLDSESTQAWRATQRSLVRPQNDDFASAPTPRTLLKQQFEMMRVAMHGGSLRFEQSESHMHSHTRDALCMTPPTTLCHFWPHSQVSLTLQRRGVRGGCRSCSVARGRVACTSRGLRSRWETHGHLVLRASCISHPHCTV